VDGNQRQTMKHCSHRPASIGRKIHCKTKSLYKALNTKKNKVHLLSKLNFTANACSGKTIIRKAIIWIFVRWKLTFCNTFMDESLYASSSQMTTFHAAVNNGTRKLSVSTNLHKGLGILPAWSQLDFISQALKVYVAVQRLVLILKCICDFVRSRWSFFT